MVKGYNRELTIAQELELEQYLREKTKLFKDLARETLLDVIKHCDFVTREKDDVIIHQGERGHRFYIILRGSVAVLHKEALEDVDLGEEGTNPHASRDSLGAHLATLSEGFTFGEIALINPDCIRTASVVADGKTDLVVIHRDLYNRSVSKVVAREYSEKINFIDSLPLLRGWQPKFRKQLAACFKKETLPFDCTLCKQGDKASDMFFIISGEVKLSVEPEGHQDQFDRFLKKYSDVLDDEGSDAQHEKAYFPQKFLPQLQKYSRVNRTSQLQQPGSPNHLTPPELPQSWSPSAIRKMNVEINSRRVKLSLCLLADKQCIGDVEFLLQLDNYHCTATCSQETTVFTLSRSHFDRLFRRRNSRSLKDMAKICELQLTRRLTKPMIVDHVPLLKCFVYKLQEEFGDRKPQQQDSENTFVLPAMKFMGNRKSTEKSRSSPKQYFWREKTDVMYGSDPSLHRLTSNAEKHFSGGKPLPRILLSQGSAKSD